MKRLVHLLVVVGIALGCTEKPSKVTDWKTDRSPVEKRFVELRGIEFVWWRGGTLGSNKAPSIPGPTDYYFEGYIKVSEAESKRWSQGFMWNQQGLPSVRSDCPVQLGSNPIFKHSDAFSKQMMPKGWQGNLSFCESARILYFNLVDIGMQ